MTAPYLLALTLLAGGGPATDFIYNCDGMAQVIVRFGPGDLTLRRGRTVSALPQGRSASGARYTDGRFVFWIKGNEATFDMGDGVLRKCRVTDRG